MKLFNVELLLVIVMFAVGIILMIIGGGRELSQCLAMVHNPKFVN